MAVLLGDKLVIAWDGFILGVTGVTRKKIKLAMKLFQMMLQAIVNVTQEERKSRRFGRKDVTNL